MATRPDARARLTIRLAYLIATAWAISFVVDIIDDTYDPPVGVHALMLIVSGWLFSDGIIKRNGKVDKGEEGL